MLDFFNQANSAYIESLFEQYKENAESIDPRWAGFFAGLEASGHSPVKTSQDGSSEDVAQFRFAEGIKDLVNRYRDLGHFSAKLNPLEKQEPALHPLLALDEIGFKPEDLKKPVISGGFLGPNPEGTLSGLLGSLQKTYCGHFGVEFRGLSTKEQRDFLQENLEPNLNQPTLSEKEKIDLYTQLKRAESFEQFIHKKYLGAKRFSVEGGESLIPLLNSVIDQAADLEVQEFILGMAHRGRLNVLAHVIQKPLDLIFSEFEGTIAEEADEGDGDVKYHLGFSCDRTTPNGGQIHCSLGANPSHLEFVNPVIEGRVRAKQEYLEDFAHAKVVPMLVHGEAAFTGQGIVPETLTLCQLPGFRTGGTIHVIVNNQIGFTALAKETRPSPYPTDIAKIIQAPIFHVNGQDPEMIVRAGKLAMEFRNKFKRDVVIDMWCFRKYGHNETDDPTFTQPLMYQKIKKMPSVVETYEAQLLEQGVLSPALKDEIGQEIEAKLNEALDKARERKAHRSTSKFEGRWKNIEMAPEDWKVETRVGLSELKKITERLCHVPEGFHIHKRLGKIVAQKMEMVEGKKGVDWATAEAWAFGTLLIENTPVRLVGQDSERGTFSHRHAVWHDNLNGETYTPLAHLQEGQAKITIINSMLSELAVLGYEFGYSIADPNNLVLWEAQFGDFVNGAQPILDLFIASSEAKWQRMSGLVLLLPHGYEGQGPEHSSARLERFLQLCADNNMVVAYPTRPAQYYHLLRQQIKRSFRKPLILMMPKSLLRHPESVSVLEDFTERRFETVLPLQRPEQAKKVLFATGKVVLKLQEVMKEKQISDIALCAIEQLYPFPEQEVAAFFKQYEDANEFAWVQEEPQNMGAWTYIYHPLMKVLGEGRKLGFHGREAAASPATGWNKLHVEEEERFISSALTLSEARN